VFRRNRRTQRLLALLLPFALACGGGDGTGIDDPDEPSPAGFLVGSWIAEELVVTNSANPDQSIDLIAEFDAIFTLDVEDSGRYTAILTGFGQSSSESGTLTVAGDILTMRATFPEQMTTVGTVRQEGGSVVLEANTTFDFNLDGTPEEAELFAVLAPNG